MENTEKVDTIEIKQNHVDELAKHLLLVSLTLATISAMTGITLSRVVSLRQVLDCELPKLRMFHQTLNEAEFLPMGEQSRSVFLSFKPKDGPKTWIQATTPAYELTLDETKPDPNTIEMHVWAQGDAPTINEIQSKQQLFTNRYWLRPTTGEILTFKVWDKDGSMLTAEKHDKIPEGTPYRATKLRFAKFEEIDGLRLTYDPSGAKFKASAACPPLMNCPAGWAKQADWSAFLKKQQITEPFDKMFPSLMSLPPSLRDVSIDSFIAENENKAKEILVKVVGIEVPLTGQPYLIWMLACIQAYALILLLNANQVRDKVTPNTVGLIYPGFRNLLGLVAASIQVTIVPLWAYYEAYNLESLWKKDISFYGLIIICAAVIAFASTILLWRLCGNRTKIETPTSRSANIGL